MARKFASGMLERAPDAKFDAWDVADVAGKVIRGGGERRRRRRRRKDVRNLRRRQSRRPRRPRSSSSSSRVALDIVVIL